MSLFAVFTFNFSKKASAPVLTRDQLAKIFMKFDCNGDKRLSREEVKQAFDYLGAYFPNYRAKQGIWYADADGDGEIDLDELDDLIDYAHQFGFTIKDV